MAWEARFATQCAWRSPHAQRPTPARSLSGDTNGAGDVHLEAAPGSRWTGDGLVLLTT
ncbi:MAG TPA: hypothetical protein VF530_23440 [Planctomycetota bacterium]